MTPLCKYGHDDKLIRCSYVSVQSECLEEKTEAGSGMLDVERLFRSREMNNPTATSAVTTEVRFTLLCCILFHNG